MKQGFYIALIGTGLLLAGPGSIAQQSPAGQDANGSKPAAPAQQGGNPFPEDTAGVPVMPNASSTPEARTDAIAPEGGGFNVALPATDTDPARSPDDAQPEAIDTAHTGESSSSFKDLEKLLPNPDKDVKPRKNKKEPTHQEAASNDIEVGKYYIERKDWKAALSRFESAMVLDPENPEVYWGLAEADRGLRNFADARANYLKLLDYDPDGPHGKAARKALKDPEIANAQNSAHGQAAPGTAK